MNGFKILLSSYTMLLLVHSLCVECRDRENEIHIQIERNCLDYSHINISSRCIIGFDLHISCNLVTFLISSLFDIVVRLEIKEGLIVASFK